MSVPEPILHLEDQAAWYRASWMQSPFLRWASANGPDNPVSPEAYELCVPLTHGLAWATNYVRLWFEDRILSNLLTTAGDPEHLETRGYTSFVEAAGSHHPRRTGFTMPRLFFLIPSRTDARARRYLVPHLLEGWDASVVTQRRVGVGRPDNLFVGMLPASRLQGRALFGVTAFPQIAASITRVQRLGPEAVRLVLELSWRPLAHHFLEYSP